MPLLVLLPILKKYGPYLIAGIVAFAGTIHIWFLQQEVAHYKAVARAFEKVQKQNEAAISAQNKAVRKLWLAGKTAVKQEEISQIQGTKILAQAVRESEKPVLFIRTATCDQDILHVFEKLGGLR